MSTLDDILSLIGGPRLADALCREDPELWDDTTDPQPAIDGCLYRCKAFGACFDWAHAQPAGRLVGIVAGEVYLHPSDRKATA
jgi:hypothetical protein